MPAEVRPSPVVHEFDESSASHHGKALLGEDGAVHAVKKSG
jgi:hypothetical protein